MQTSVYSAATAKLACTNKGYSCPSRTAYGASLFAIQSLRPRVGDIDPALVALTGTYHNLLRLWSGR